jgi:hypothetical protein
VNSSVSFKPFQVEYVVHLLVSTSVVFGWIQRFIPTHSALQLVQLPTFPHTDTKEHQDRLSGFECFCHTKDFVLVPLAEDCT